MESVRNSSWSERVLLCCFDVRRRRSSRITRCWLEIANHHQNILYTWIILCIALHSSQKISHVMYKYSKEGDHWHPPSSFRFKAHMLSVSFVVLWFWHECIEKVQLSHSLLGDTVPCPPQPLDRRCAQCGHNCFQSLIIVQWQALCCNLDPSIN